LKASGNRYAGMPFESHSSKQAVDNESEREYQEQTKCSRLTNRIKCRTESCKVNVAMASGLPIAMLVVTV
jgi:hypothetical protein